MSAAVSSSGLFRQPDFVRLWSVGLVVFVVRWLETLAVGVVIYRDTGSPLLVAMMTMLRMLPMALLGAVFGAIAERVDRRVALICTVVQMMLTSVALTALAYTGYLAVWHMAVASFLNGLSWAADNPVRRAMMGEAVGGERMARAMSADVASNNSSRMLGPTLGGTLLAVVGIEGASALCAALYLFALWAAIGVSPPARHPASTASFLARMAEGMAVVRRDRRLIATLLVTIIYNVFGWPFSSMIVVLGKDNFGLGPIGVGILSSTEGIGAFIGALSAALWAKPRQYGRVYCGGVILYLIALMVFAQVSNPIVGGLALLMTGVGGACFAAMQTTIVYLASPPEVRARVLGILSVCIGSAAIGFVQLGVIANIYGAVAASTFTGVAGLLAMALTWRWWKLI